MSKKWKNRDGKNENVSAKEKKVEQKLFRLMPALPKLLRQVRDRIESFDPKQPKTFMAGLEADFKAFELTLEGRERRVWRLLWFLYGKSVVQIQADQFARQTIADLKELAGADKRYSMLLKLMHETDKQVPFAALFVFCWHGDPRTAWFPQFAPMDLLIQAEQETGEARATTVLRALSAISEVLYKPYLWTLWFLSYVKEGQVPPQAPEFGELVKQMHRRLADYPGLVEPDAGWMRNSAVHNMPEYLLEDDSVVMWDRHHERTKVRVDDLLEMVQRMYLISGMTIMHVSQLYMFRDLFVKTGLFKMLVDCIPLVIAHDELRLSMAEQEMKKVSETFMEPIGKFFGFQS